MKKARRFLNESLKIEILIAYRQIGPKWNEISKRLDVCTSTARSFVERYKKSGKLNRKMGRPIKIMEEIKDGIIGAVEFEPETTLKSNFIGKAFNLFIFYSIFERYGFFFSNKLRSNVHFSSQNWELSFFWSATYYIEFIYI